MGKHKKKHHRLHVKQHEHRTFDSTKLLRYAALGKTRKLRSLLEVDATGELLNAAADPSGAGALHQACRHGHVDAAALLLRRHADPSAVDAAGNTPGHLAAMHGHVVLLSELIKNARDPVDLDLPNSAGLSIRDILQQQQQHQGQYDPAPGHPGDADSSRESPTRSGSSEEGRGWHNGHGSSRVMGASAEHQASDAAAAAVADDEWNARLADEMSDDEGGWGNLYRGPWGAAAAAAAVEHTQGRSTAAGEDSEVEDDAWADRLWQDMQNHKQSVGREAAAAKAASAAQRQGFVGDRDAAAQERQRRAAEAAAESERILKEERAKDSDWRAAMMRQIEEAALPVKRVTYEQHWAALDTWPAHKPITYKDIPWPPVTAAAGSHRPPGPQQQPDLKIDIEKLRTLVFGGATGPAALKAALRKELMRWHPDKFGARFGSRLAAPDRESVLAGVQAVAQQLTALKAV